MSVSTSIVCASLISLLTLTFLFISSYHYVNLVYSAKEQKNYHRCLVRTHSGALEGRLLTFGEKEICEFIGIPYGEPPLNNLRFMKPKPTKWSGILQATEWGPECMQVFPKWAHHMMRRTTRKISEDCLYLNIWTRVIPKKMEEQSSPVLFWIHGGGFQFGSGSLDETNGTFLALEGDAIVVTINYRLNAFGFLNVQAEGNFGNQGLYDQALALDWVRLNIRGFGGDAERITMWGQGMGGMSISAHLVSPVTKNKFRRAIIQTGSIFTTEVMYSQHEKVAQQLSDGVGCNSSLLEEFPGNQLLAQALC